MRTILSNIASYIIYLLPFTLLTGPFLPDLSIVIVCLIFLYISIKNQLWEYYYNKFFIFFIIFYIYLIICSLLSDFKIESLYSSFFYFRFIIFSLAIWFLANEKKEFIKIFSIFLFVIFGIALFDGFYQYFFNENIFGFSSKLTRLNILLNDDLILGGYLARLAPLMIGLIILNYSHSKLYLGISLIFLILCDVLIYLSGERTALGLLFLSTIFIIIFLNKFKILRISSFILSFIIIVIFTFYSSEIRERNIDHTINQLGLNSITSNEVNTRNESEESIGKSKLYIFSPQHHSYILTSINMFIDSPIFGNGPNTYRYLCGNINFSYDEQSCSTHPHNIYAQVLSEIGLVGFLMILTLVVFLIYQMKGNLYFFVNKKSNSLTDFQICLFACFLMTLWPFFPTQNFFNNWINIIYYLPIGFYLYTIQNK